MPECGEIWQPASDYLQSVVMSRLDFVGLLPAVQKRKKSLVQRMDEAELFKFIQDTTIIGNLAHLQCHSLNIMLLALWAVKAELFQ
jgi:hypothetical protein